MSQGRAMTGPGELAGGHCGYPGRHRRRSGDGVVGAGRGTAAKVLEDLGWYVADNLPPQLITRMVDLGMDAGSRITNWRS